MGIPMKKFSFVKGLLPADGLDFSGFHTSFLEERAMEVFLPKEVILPMIQHRGAAAEVAVRVGEYVRVGQVVGRPADSFGTPVHAGVSGRVTKMMILRLPDGRRCAAVCVESDGKRAPYPFVKKTDGSSHLTPKDLMQLLYKSGIVGMGGDGEPTFFKCQRAIFAGADTLYVNGLQSEPYLTCDSYQLREYSEKVIQGAVALASVLKVNKIRFCIQDKWVREITAMYSALESCGDTFPDRDMELLLFRSRYPQGYERLLGQAVYGGEIDRSKTFEEQYQAVVLNVSTCCAFADVIEKNQPCVSRIITLSVNDAESKNILVPIGTPVSEILAAVPEKKNARVILGGSLTGIPLTDTYFPILKMTSGITIMEEFDGASTECIRCGACAEACPVKLIPYLAESCILRENKKVLGKMPMERCISCGSCSYVCPSRRDLSFHIARYAHSKRLDNGEVKEIVVG